MMNVCGSLSRSLSQLWSVLVVKSGLLLLWLWRCFINGMWVFINLDKLVCSGTISSMHHQVSGGEVHERKCPQELQLLFSCI